MATEQGYYALAAYDRMINGKTALYDMSDVTLQKGTAGAEGEGPADQNTDSKARYEPSLHLLRRQEMKQRFFCGLS